MRPIAGVQLDHPGDDRPKWETKKPEEEREATYKSEERSAEDFGPESNDEKTPALRRRQEKAAEGKTDGEEKGEYHPEVALPPYVMAYAVGNSKSYVFVVPRFVRPKSWPTVIPLGNDHGKGPGLILSKAWALYSSLMHSMHEEQLKFERELHPATLKDVAKKYEESDDYKGQSEERQKRFRKIFKKLKKWLEKNKNPPIGSITPDHIYGFLLSSGDTHAERLELKSTLSTLYEKAIDLGYTDTNAAAKAPMPHPKWERIKVIHSVAHPMDIFAHNAPALTLKIK